MKKSLAYPYILWMVIFIISPLLIILYYSFTKTTNGLVEFTLDNYIKVFDPLYTRVILSSIYLALISTVICFILGYPVAYIMAEKDFKAKSSLVFLFLVPMWMNFLLRTYAWITILETNGIFNSVISFFGFDKVEILYTQGAVVLGMVYNFLPFMILPIYTILKKIDKSYIEAAQDLGANSKEVFFRVVFPMSLPGVVSGITMVFLPAITTFVISDLLGGSKVLLIGHLIERQFMLIGDWNFGSAISIILLIIVLVFVWLINLISSVKERSVA